MLSLSPLKLLVVFVVVMLVLGPDKMPDLARQAGAAWRSFRSFHQKIEEDVRKNLPDLPSTADLARYTRAPGQFLNDLASKPLPAEGGEVAAEPLWQLDPLAPHDAHEANGEEAPTPESTGPVLGDPSMN